MFSCKMASCFSQRKTCSSHLVVSLSGWTEILGRVPRRFSRNWLGQNVKEDNFLINMFNKKMLKKYIIYIYIHYIYIYILYLQIHPPKPRAVHCGKIAIIPKPEWRGLRGFPLYSPPFGVTNRRELVARIYPIKNDKLEDPMILRNVRETANVILIFPWFDGDFLKVPP